MRMWKSTIQPGRPQMTIWRMRVARWIPETTNTHSECVMFIAFPRHQWLHERASVLRYTYICCHVTFCHTWIHHSLLGNAGLDLDSSGMLCCLNTLKY
jgi:hypothetical protein